MSTSDDAVQLSQSRWQKQPNMLANMRMHRKCNNSCVKIDSKFVQKSAQIFM